MIRLDITASDVATVVADLQATPRQARAAMSSTITRMTRWLVRGVTLQLRADLQLPPATLRKRVVRAKIRQSSSGISARLWVGTNPVGLHEYGGRQTRQGVKNKRGTHAGTFLAVGKGQSRRVIFKRRGTDRLPIDKQTVAIVDAANRAIDKVMRGSSVDEWFFREFERELMRRVSRARGR